MNEAITIKSPIRVESDSKEQVAFDLMKHIARDDKRCDGERGDRKYWLTLYHQCLDATSGFSLETILKEESH